MKGYIFNIESGKSELILSRYIMNIRDSIESPKWSPDGNSVIFSQRGYSTSKIGILNLSTKNVEYISPEDPHDRNPIWVSYKNKIIFIYNNIGTRNLCSMNNDGSDRNIILSNIDSGYRYSINSKEIIVYSDGTDLYTIDVMGNNKKKIRDGDSIIWKPRWSPDEKYVVYLDGWLISPMNREDNFHYTEIYKTNINTKRTQQLTNNNVIEEFPSWIDI